MAEKFKGKYRVPAARLISWDYRTQAAYFVTICTERHTPYFGEIVPGGAVGSNHMTVDEPVNPPVTGVIETPCMSSLQGNPSPASTSKSAVMRLSELGQVVYAEWLQTPDLRPDMNLILGKFVVMPDHFHAIIIIGNNEFNTNGCGDGRDAMHGVSAGGDFVNGRDAMHGVSTFGPQQKNLASVIRGFKSAVTTYARKNNISFEWQTRFYDRIIRDDEEYERIEKYIANNPVKWLENHDPA